MMTLAAQLAARRADLSLTAEEVATRAGLAGSRTIYKLERGERGGDASTWAAVAEAVDCDLALVPRRRRRGRTTKERNQT